MEKKLSCCGVLKLCVCDNACTHVYVFGYMLFLNRKYACVCVCYSGGGVGWSITMCMLCVCLNEYIGCVRTCDFWNAQCPLSPKSVAVLITSLTEV